MEKREIMSRVIFDHMPKTAGMSVSTWLKESLGEGLSVWLMDPIGI